MSLKYRRSVLFDKPGGTTKGIELQTIVNHCKQRLKLNSQSTTRVVKRSTENLTALQAKSIETLASKLKTVSFHEVYSAYQRASNRDENGVVGNPESLALFRAGKYHRFSQKPKRRVDDAVKHQLMEYFERKPEEQLVLQNNQQKSTVTKQSCLSINSRRSISSRRF